MTRLLLGLCEASMKSGITQLIAIIETPMLRLYQKCGLNPVVLGRAKTDHCSIMVCLWETNAKVLRNMREKLNYHASVLEDYAPYPLQLAA
jgi:N-acyl-L-homoserine lactone synthetase